MQRCPGQLAQFDSRRGNMPADGLAPQSPALERLG